MELNFCAKCRGIRLSIVGRQYFHIIMLSVEDAEELVMDMEKQKRKQLNCGIKRIIN